MSATTFDYLDYPFPSRRTVNMAKNGMVATSQPLAAQAGLSLLREGGNAIDAAVGTAAALTVLEPTSNGIGSDAFAIVWQQGEMAGLNSSGPAPSSISISKLTEDGYEEMPRYGWPPVTVPGAPAAWAALSERYGRLPFERVLRPAITYAREGYPISPVLGASWRRAYSNYKEELTEKQFENWFATFAPQDRPPRIGEVWSSLDHSNTLEKIAESEAESFYRGELAELISDFSRANDGYLRESDLASFAPEWVDPLKVDYRGHQVWELPPNGQGLIALIALNILKGFDFPCRERVETFHKQIEALKLAFSDGKEYITDPQKMQLSPELLLDPAYAESRRDLIQNEALIPSPGKPPQGGTVYLAAADGDGNMVSYIQSNYMGFGSGLVVPETGIALQNRGNTFSLDPSKANRLEPSKRPYHTIIPGFLTRQGKPVGPFGVMGGFMQPQGHLQVLMNMLDFDLNPQAALDAPRWCWLEDKEVLVEDSFPRHLAKSLQRKGHRIDWAWNRNIFGRGQIILREGETLIGGTEPRTDSSIAAF